MHDGNDSLMRGDGRVLRFLLTGIECLDCSWRFYIGISILRGKYFLILKFL